MKRKVSLILSLIFSGVIIFFYGFNRPEFISNNGASKTVSSIAGNSSIQVYSSVAVSSISNSTISYDPWTSYLATTQDLEQVGEFVGYGHQKAAFQFIKIDISYLDSLAVGDIVTLTIPGAPAIDMNITDISRDAMGRSIVGHLSGYSEPYYIGFTYSNTGEIYGDLTTERDNYSIRTFYGKAVVFRNWIDPGMKIFDGN